MKGIKQFVRWINPVWFFWLLVPPLMWWALRDVPLTQISATLLQLTPVQILILLTVNGLAVFAFSGRWWVILRGLETPVPLIKLTAYRLAAFSVSVLTPGPQFGGEPLQVLALTSRHKLPASTVTASVGLDKLIELIVNFSFLAAGALLVVSQGFFDMQSTVVAALIAAGLLMLLLGFVLLLWNGKQPLTWLLRRFPVLVEHEGYLVNLKEQVASIETQAAELCRKHPPVLLGALGVSLLSWLVMIIEYWLVLRFLQIPVTFIEGLAALLAVRLALLTPLPGGLGVLEAGQVLVFEALGADAAAGLGVSAIIRTRDFLLILPGVWIAGRVLKHSRKKEPTSSGISW